MQLAPTQHPSLQSDGPQLPSMPPVPPPVPEPPPTPAPPLSPPVPEPPLPALPPLPPAPALPPHMPLLQPSAPVHTLHIAPDLPHAATTSPFEQTPACVQHPAQF